MNAQSKIALATAAEEARVAYEFLSAASAPGSDDRPGHLQSLVESAAQRTKIVLRKCAEVWNAECAPVHAKDSGRRKEPQEERAGVRSHEAYQTVQPAISRADSRHIMAREVVRDAS